jgi:plasmid stability protein
MQNERIKVTLSLDAEVVRAYRIQAARTGQRDNAVVEAALRQQLGLDWRRQFDLLQSSLSDEQADAIAVQAVRELRQARKSTT